MGKQSSDSFIHEIRLKTTPHGLSVLNKRLDVARQLYNACLGESLKRLRLARQSKAFQQAIKMPKQIKNKQGKLINNKKRTALFKESNSKIKFTDYGIQDYVLALRKKNWLGEHIDSLTSQKLANRAFKAVYSYAIGLRGKPRFKGFNRLSSIEGKNNASGIRFQSGYVHWSGLRLSTYPIGKDKHGLATYALSCKTKYVRLIKRVIKNKDVWYVQLVQAGKPFIKEKNISSDDIVGLDIGPSTIAAVNREHAQLQAFCDEVKNYDPQIKALQRKINRSMRANNPTNYEETKYKKNNNGKTIIKHGKPKPKQRWHYSNNCKTLKSEVAELHRKMAAARNTSQGNLANQILRMGNIIKTEKLSYKGFQKLYGRSILKRSPATFIGKLCYKAENAGGMVEPFSTYKTALSQTCVCGYKQKKPLKQRWHNCSNCGATAQRDLFSANLARYVEKDSLDMTQAQQAWAGVDILLRKAVSKLKETANGQSKSLSSFGLNQRQSGSPEKEKSIINEALDVVGISRELKKVNDLVLRTPCL